ncbi:MAG TPA: hypothetical protein VEI29_08595, partial [Burkholderiaceae bacterium]|nr:hypothetical protein [Burkholderiaceae bacterium]
MIPGCPGSGILLLVADMNADSNSLPPAAVHGDGIRPESPAQGHFSRLSKLWAWAARHKFALLFLLAYVLADAVDLFPNPRFGVQPWNPQPALALAL